MTHYQKIMLAIGLAGIVLLGLLVFSIYRPQQKKLPVVEEKTNKEEVKKDLKEVTFCGKVYKVDGDTLVIDGVDVMERIAEIASKNTEDNLCKSLDDNLREKVFSVDIQEKKNDLDYKKGDYYIYIPTHHFKVERGKIYNLGGFDGTLSFYGNLK